MRIASGLQARLLRIYWTLKGWIAPTLTSSQFVYRDTLLAHLKQRPRWLDLGCGHQFLPDWVGSLDAELLSSLPRIAGVDGDFESIRQHVLLKNKILADISYLPFSPDSFDLVSANMVMEHVHNPALILSEVRRVLAPGGLFLFHTPHSSSPLIFMASLVPERLKKWLIGILENRSEEDIYPTAYQINTRGKVAGFGAAAGYDVERCSPVATEAVTAILGPLAVFELLYIRLTQLNMFQSLRPDLIVVLRKPAGAVPSAPPVLSQPASVD